MGRNIPVVEITSSSHPTWSLALVVVWMGALVAIASSLCGIWSKKAAETGHEDKDEEATGSLSGSPKEGDSEDDDDEDGDGSSKPLPHPPSELGEHPVDKKQKPQLDKSLSSLQPYISKNKSKKKMSVSLSMKMPTKIKDKAHDLKGKAHDLKDDIGHHTGLKHHEDSLWSKRIMIGEKCRLPHDDDDQGVQLDTEIRNRILIKSQSQIGSSTRHPSSFLDQQMVSTIGQEETSADKLKGKDIQSDHYS